MLLIVAFGNCRAASSDKKLAGLNKDCQALLRDTNRLLQKIASHQGELGEFQSALINQGDHAIANRSAVWVNSVLFDLNKSFNLVSGQYEHCMCLASEEFNDESGLAALQGLLNQVKQQYAQLGLKQTALIEKAELLKKQAQLNLN